MEAAKLTFKGQVTIPKKVRIALGIEPGDSILFSIEGDQAILKPFKKKSLLDFYGVLPSTREYPGSETVRSEFHRKVAEKIVGK